MFSLVDFLKYSLSMLFENLDLFLVSGFFTRISVNICLNNLLLLLITKILTLHEVVLGGLGVTCSPRDPSFAGSNPVEFDGFFQDVKILSTSPPGRILSWGSRF